MLVEYKYLMGKAEEYFDILYSVYTGMASEVMDMHSSGSDSPYNIYDFGEDMEEVFNECKEFLHMIHCCFIPLDLNALELAETLQEQNFVRKMATLKDLYSKIMLMNGTRPSQYTLADFPVYCM